MWPAGFGSVATADVAAAGRPAESVPAGITTSSGCLPWKLISWSRNFAYSWGLPNRSGIAPRSIGCEISAILSGKWACAAAAASALRRLCRAAGTAGL